ncbi:hypothetical protein [Wolbachia endosymbiont (group A) of Rhinocyllus conicus]|uniref:hypothetical protein n=1 Tax=Wolbachia endosymbiont (group A) of Rhinocyllus conicus TaxID=2954053 RepID=UPI002226FADE|nr:hypothetical protein [Wolbachia endosymbiont (group A) of Rhinocyllus conicus]
MHNCTNFLRCSRMNVRSGGLCCIATYERLTIARIISNLLKILFFCNQSDQI